MSKKNFKTGLDNLIVNSNIDDSIKNNGKKDETVEGTDVERINWLLLKIERLQDELHKWRTGFLTVDEFHDSLKKFNLKYNSETNDFEVIG